jgi:hypothetical protein
VSLHFQPLRSSAVRYRPKNSLTFHASRSRIPGDLKLAVKKSAELVRELCGGWLLPSRDRTRLDRLCTGRFSLAADPLALVASHTITRPKHGSRNCIALASLCTLSAQTRTTLPCRPLRLMMA